MIYLFLGKDREAARREAASLRDGLLKKKPDAAVVRFSEDSLDLGALESHIAGQGLFNRASIIFCDGIFGKPEAKEFFLERAEDIASSPNIFILIEPKLDASSKKKLAALAAKMVEKEPAAATPFSKGGGFNIFSLAEALAARDSRALFSRYHDALRHEISPEEISGTLFWQVKTLRLARLTRSAEEAGIKPFVYGKAKKALALWQPGELERLSMELVSLYHDAHEGKRDLALGLERLALAAL